MGFYNGKLGGSLCRVSSIRCRSSLSVLLLEQLQHLRERLKNIRQSLSYQNKHVIEYNESYMEFF